MGIRPATSLGARGGVASHNVADQILDYLAVESATLIFGIPGAGLANMLERLHKRREEFRFVVCRHESAAAYMADGYYRATGKPGVVMVTSGPGATNALTGTMNAQFGGSAVLALTGEVGQPYLGRGYLQEGTDCGLDVRAIFAAATAYSADLADAASAPILIEQALRDMLSVPRRAVRIGVPDNVAASPSCGGVAPRPPWSSAAYRCAPGGAPAKGVQRALEILGGAKRPLILLGHGCREAVRDPDTARALRCLAEWWQIPIMTTSDGKGVFPETHSLSFRTYGLAGCQWPQFWMIGQDGKPAHDALIVIGSSLGELATYRWNPMLVPSGSFLQVDINPAVIGRGFPVTDGCVAEAGAFLRGLWERSPAWPRDVAAVEERGRTIAALKQTHAPVVSPAAYASEARPLHPAALCRLLNKLLPENALVFIDCGNCVGWGLHYLIIDRAQECHSSLAMGPMGFAVCGVIGARVGAPDRLAVALVGDGALLMHAGEISTAAKHRIGAVWVVLADDDLRMVTQGMEMLFPANGGFAGMNELGKPDLVRLARSLGADAWPIAKTADLDEAWPMVLSGADRGRPQMIVVQIDTTAAPPYYDKPYWQQKLE
ncbi:MAG: thiamine pyrophosphate-binding protein [Proteobacteria bacterium]|nr:thiamine pyrophosphate-binding protein [Pseudomonadota bacterium]